MAAVSMSASFLKAEVVMDGLVSSWTFDSNTIDGKTVRDVWGKNHGTIFGSPSVEKGRFGEALRFDGTKDYIDCGNDASLDFERDDAFSTEAWVNIDRDAGTHMVILGKMLSSGTYKGWISFWYRGAAPNPDTIQSLLRNDNATGNYILVRTQDVLPDTEWIHMVLTYDGSSKASGVKFYVNGENVLLTIATDGLSDDIREKVNVNIGARDFGKAPFFKGLIDEMRIYSRDLTEEEVKQNFLAEGFKVAVKPGRKLALTWGEIKA